MVNIKIILGSSRPQRFGIQPAEWIKGLADQVEGAKFELVDLQKVKLPFLDEAVPAMMGTYSQDHTKAWSKLIDGADGFIFVAPEYNHGYSPVLKNAIDFLFKEWNYKPVTFVSYGAEAGGLRAVEQLRQVVGWVKMYDLSEFVSIPNYWTQLSETGKFQPNEQQVDLAQKMLKSLVFWSEQMKKSRKELGK
jgi:NAD(P)H-dependent FMN reductase